MLTGSDSLLCYVQFGFYRPAEKLPPLPLPWLVAKSWPVWFIQSKLLIKKPLATHWRTHVKTGIFIVPSGQLHLTSGLLCSTHTRPPLLPHVLTSLEQGSQSVVLRAAA